MIEGKRVILHTFREEDVHELVRLGSRYRDIGEFWPVSLPTEQKYRQEYEKNGWWGEEGGNMVITDRQDKRMVGHIGFFKSIPYMEGFEIGYRILSPEDRNHGYMTEALRLFSAYLFEWLTIPRLQLTVLKGNEASRSVAESCGFLAQGALAEAVWNRGELCDLQFFAIKRADCPRLKDLLAD